jgi:chemotaxis protein MotB
MSGRFFKPWLVVGALAFLSGCESAMVNQGKLKEAEQQQANAAKQYQALQEKAYALDRDNQEMVTLLSQARQQARVSEDQLAEVRAHLRTVTEQLAQSTSDKEGMDKRVQAMNASMQRQGGVTISPNTSYLQTLPAANIPGIAVRKDGDVIRIEMPGTTLFEPGTARLRPGAANLITDVAAEIARTYPDQIIGVEGHNDNDPVMGGQSRNSHELSVNRAMAVYDVLINRTRLQANQLFVVGRGPINPIVSNATPEGKQRNRRVELVIYPERKN